MGEAQLIALVILIGAILPHVVRHILWPGRFERYGKKILVHLRREAGATQFNLIEAFVPHVCSNFQLIQMLAELKVRGLMRHDSQNETYYITKKGRAQVEHI